MTKVQKSILGGASILGIAGIICKLVGVVYKVPLAWVLGDGGMGTYHLVFPTYNLLLTISSAGIPVAISRMVSAYLNTDDPRNARRVFKCALGLLACLGLIATLIMLVGADALSRQVNDPDSRLGFMAIAPSVFLVCVMSAFRGFMQGQQNMTPTALSQLIEQVGKVAVALPLAAWGNRYGIAWGAAGALLGTTLTEGIALIYMLVLYLRRRSRFNQIPQGSAEAEPMGRLAKTLTFTAIPITLGACIVPLSGTVDSMMMLGRMMVSGLSETVAREWYGAYAGYVLTWINVPTALVVAVAMSLVPAISGALARGDQKALQHQANLGLKMSFLIGFPCSIGMSLLSREILSFFYEHSMKPENLTVASELLSVSALTVVLFSAVQSTSAILQGVKKQRIPMYTLMAGVAVKIVLNYTLTAIPGINIHAAPISSLVCYTVSLVPNLYYTLKYTGMKFDWHGCLDRPLAASLTMGLAVWALKTLLPAGRLTTILLVVIGVAAFGLFAILFKAVTMDDLKGLKRRKRA